MADRPEEPSSPISDAWYRQIVEECQEGVWATDPAGRTLFANRRMAEMLRCSEEQLAAAGVWDFVDDEEARAIREDLVLLQSGDIERHERVFRRADGTRMPALVSSGPLTSPDGGHAGSFGIILDLSDRDEVEGRLAEREARLRALFDHAAVGQMLISPDGLILRANRTAERLFGMGSGELLGRDPLDLATPEDQTRIRELGRAILSGERDSGDLEMQFDLADGVTIRLLTSVGVVRDSARRALYLTAVIQDVTERRRAEQRLADLAHYDPVTGLANRTLLDLRLEGALAGSDGEIGVLFVDLDGFKVVNDTFGHAVGDLLLAAIAERIRNATRPVDTTARFGGDEFVVVAPVERTADLEALAERLLETIRAPFEVEGRTVQIDMSVGVAVGAPGTAVASALLHEADLAMYRAKAAGGSRWMLHGGDGGDRHSA
jgi:diguanylate cyclase (GGDEF)-like protein/PAS domain S-box-containing protein